MDVEIHPLVPQDLAGAVAVLGEAFATQPSSLAIWKNASDRGRRVGRVFRGMLKHMGGEKYTAKLDGEIVGAMRIATWPVCQMKPLQGLKMLPSLLKSGGPGSMKRGMKLRSTWARRDPRKPHWHLDPLGVSPRVQGKGVGSRMMQFYLERVDASGLPAYHETDRWENLPFYEKFGFQVLDEEEILGFRNWYMWREGRGGK